MTTALVIDPGLVLEQGHDYSALLRVKTELSKLGVKHTCLASIRAEATVRKQAMPVLPLKGLWWRSEKTMSEFLAHTAEMSRQLSFAFNEQKRLPDLLVLPCCDAVLVQALARHLGRSRWVPAPHLVIWLLFPELLDEYRGAFAELKEAIGDDRKIAVYCETASMAAAFGDRIGLEVGVAPCPNVAGASGKVRSRRRNQTPRIVSIGFGNKAKGYHLLPEAVERVLRSNSEVTFFIHGVLSDSDQAGDTAVFKALSEMGQRVVTSNAVLTPEEYLSYFLQADLLLLPYDEKVYGMRGSGVFNEAREIGIPIVATRGCSFAQPAFDQRWGIEIIERSGSGLAQAILTAIDRLPDLTARAGLAAKVDADDVGTALQKAVSTITSHDRLRRVAASCFRQIRWDKSASYRLPSSLFSRVDLRDGASISGKSPAAALELTSEQPDYETIDFAVLTSAIIDTSPVPYRYSVLLHVDLAITRRLKRGRLVAVEISIEVLAGMVGIVWTDEEYRPLEDTERYAPAMPGIQRVLISAPCEQAHFLVFRNVATDSTATSFQVSRFRTWSAKSRGRAGRI